MAGFDCAHVAVDLDSDPLQEVPVGDSARVNVGQPVSSLTRFPI